LLNLEKFDIKLDTDIIGRNFVYCEEVDSTNSFLLRDEDLYDGTVVLAEKQLAGKGRRGRSWFSTEGLNLTFSILLKRRIIRKNVNLYNLGAALAVAYSLENLYQVKVDLKWPNDILVGGKKVGGILLESNMRGQDIQSLVVGMGINVNQISFKDTFNIPPTSIKKIVKNEIIRENLLSEILNNYEIISYRIDTQPTVILNEWKSRCKAIGEKIKVEEGENIKYGIFEDINDEGFLILKTAEGSEIISVGDVSIK